MKIETTRFGEIDIEEERVIAMPSGMLGFPGNNRYAIMVHSKESPFNWLQSVDDPAVAFVIVDPLLVQPDYQISVHPSDVLEIEIEDPSKALFLVVVNIAKDYSLITANLQGPIVINAEKRLAKQLVLYNSPYSTKHIIYSKEGQKKKEAIA